MTFLIVMIIALFICGVVWFTTGRKIWGDKNNERLSQGLKWGIRTVLALIVLIYVVCNSVTVVSVGTTKVGEKFGYVDQHPYEQGMRIVNPFLSFTIMNVQRQVLEFQSNVNDGASNDEIAAVSSDNLPLTIDVTFAFELNPKYAWWVYQKIGTDQVYVDRLMKQTARSATRSATALFTTDEATTTKREELALMMEKHFSLKLREDMVRQGLPEADASLVFNVLPVQLRKALPPEKVLNSIAEKAAAMQDLERQTTLTLIARQEAERRGQEGAGIKKLFAELPEGFTPEQIAVIVNSLAAKSKADAMLKAVETGKVSVMVLDGSTGGVSLPVK